LPGNGGGEGDEVAVAMGMENVRPFLKHFCQQPGRYRSCPIGSWRQGEGSTCTDIDARFNVLGWIFDAPVAGRVEDGDFMPEMHQAPREFVNMPGDPS
jgi:hypothetical protein